MSTKQILIDEATVKLALEALEYTTNLSRFLLNDEANIGPMLKADEAITSLRQAIAEAEKQEQGEPVAWMDKNKFEHLKKNNAVLTTVTSWSAFDDDVPLYTTPQPKREWVGLTDEEIDAEADKEEQAHGFIQGVAWAEAKLREKNSL